MFKLKFFSVRRRKRVRGPGILCGVLLIFRKDLISYTRKYCSKTEPGERGVDSVVGGSPRTNVFPFDVGHLTSRGTSDRD